MLFWNEFLSLCSKLGSLIHKKCHLKNYHSDIKYHMTLNIIFSVVFVARPVFILKIGVKMDIAKLLKLPKNVL